MFEELLDKLGSRARRDEMMSKHTTFRIGGPAALLADVENVDELRLVLEVARRNDLPWTVLGKGSNVLVRDAGFPGIVIRLGGVFGELKIEKDAAEAGAGCSLGRLVDETVKRGMNAFCWAAGIPGTVGGAVAGNAGSWGHATGEFVESVTVMDERGNLHELALSLPSPEGGGDETMVRFSYRSVRFPFSPRIVMRARLRLPVLESEERGPAKLKAYYLARKRESQPLELPNAGSVFKNPKGESAGSLIDRAGCKGLREGGAIVSEKHANFILNAAGATATDVLRLIETVRRRVLERFGTELELELRVL